ncbi:MAG TPA: hypothetical protein VFQ42_21850 [Mycobacterium sp.]|nr:hypothetical protein [Mycobacterium sp.]
MTRRESSAETAARYLALRSRKVAQYRGGHRPRAQLRVQPAPRRIVLDLAEPTLRLIHDVLLDAIHGRVNFGANRRHLLLIAEQMVAVALGESPCDDPPLTDRGAGHAR